MNNKDTGLKWRAWVTVLSIFVLLTSGYVYGMISPAIDGAAAAQQVNGGDGALLKNNVVLHALRIFQLVIFAMLTLVWVSWLARPFTYLPTRKSESEIEVPNAETEGPCGTPDECCGRKATGRGVAMALLALVMTGCGPARFDKFIEIGPNETAFVIPLMGDTVGNQVKFNSVEYLNTKKVATKRITVPLMEKSTGRFGYDYEWIDTIRVIKVNRSLVSKEWTKETGVPVVTKDGIQLSLGVAITVFIEEDDAPTYLYYHGEQPLEQVASINIRNFCISELTREYGTADLTEAKQQGPQIFAKLYKDAQVYFKTKGISIQQLGNAEGYVFKNEAIQESINKRFTAEQDIATATQEKLAQDQRNKKLLATAETTATAAKLIYEAKEATTLQNQLEIATMRAKASITMAEKWNGAMPANILPADSPMLLNLGTSATAPVKH